MEEAIKAQVKADNKIDALQFWTYFDLKDRRIIGSRTDLHRKQRFHGFPKPIHLTGHSAVFRVADVVAWVEARAKSPTGNSPSQRERSSTGQLVGKRQATE